MLWEQKGIFRKQVHPHWDPTLDLSSRSSSRSIANLDHCSVHLRCQQGARAAALHTWARTVQPRAISLIWVLAWVLAQSCTYKLIQLILRRNQMSIRCISYELYLKTGSYQYFALRIVCSHYLCLRIFVFFGRKVTWYQIIFLEC